MPPSTVPSSAMPPPKHGSGPLVGAIVVMLLLMGGLIFWKFSADDPKTEPTLAPPKAAESPVFEAPPPPPPVPTADAGTEKVAKGGGNRGTFTGPNPCTGTCEGKMTPSLQSALHGRAGMSRRCYERALQSNATLAGRLTINVRVAKNGTLCSSGVGSNSLGDASVANCVVGVFRSGAYPPANGGCVDAAVPINFVPRKN